MNTDYLYSASTKSYRDEKCTLICSLYGDSMKCKLYTGNEVVNILFVKEMQ